MRSIGAGLIAAALATTMMAPSSHARMRRLKPRPKARVAPPLTVSPEPVSVPPKSAAPDRANAVILEALGRGFVYSINFDRSITERLAVGAGVSHWNASALGFKYTVTVIPVYANYAFLEGKYRPFVTAGADVVVVSEASDGAYFESEREAKGNAITDSGSGLVAVAGAGYELRTDGGLLFRAGPYLLLGRNLAALWAGISFGARF